jgi:hypothetical protein
VFKKDSGDFFWILYVTRLHISAKQEEGWKKGSKKGHKKGRQKGYCE